jgi:hypothetical protein
MRRVSSVIGADILPEKFLLSSLVLLLAAAVETFTHYC